MFFFRFTFNFNFQLNENDLGDLVILQHTTCYDLYKNYLPRESVDLMKILRNQLATAHAQHANMMGRHRDNFFIRNDDGPLFGRRRGDLMGRDGRWRDGVIFEINFLPNEEIEPNGFERPGGLDLHRERQLDLMEQLADDNNDNLSDSDSGNIHRTI